MYIKDGKEGYNMFQLPNQTPFMQQGPGFNPGFGSNIPNPYQQIPASVAQPAQSRGLQGLLGRIFSKNTANAPSMMQPMQIPGQAASQFAGQVATQQSTGGLANTLGNVQQVLKVAQQATPLIKEYGPMVKNAPKIMGMIKALSEIQDDDEESIEDNEIEEQENEEPDIEDFILDDDNDDNDDDADHNDELDIDDLFETRSENEHVEQPTIKKTRSKSLRSNPSGESTPKLFI